MFITMLYSIDGTNIELFIYEHFLRSFFNLFQVHFQQIERKEKKNQHTTPMHLHESILDST